ncbi:MAG TPA: GlsB/YeaQ/YmgE family stress response membrane protein [Candidatus Deferrimicrobium sp.]|nr:GlsB/YeaQ/YmgE family stress response membrane protein [Candidatus Kapabacteria bacterium]HLP62239.1 GlsB/YeaQ/YmgE family stress response membrane protein [Candidatus Deferrimicrobium sp.]
MIRLLVLLLIAFICGSIGASIAGYSRKGCLTSIALGFIGALIGGWLSRQVGVGDLFYFRDIPILWSIIGAALFVAVINLIIGGRSRG